MQSSSSAISADRASSLTSSEAGEGESTVKRNCNSKRTRAGFQVTQTTTMGSEMVSQQPLEDRPPSKRKCLVNKDWKIESSSTLRQSGLESMETETPLSTDAAFTPSKGINNAISINLPTVSDNGASASNERSSVIRQDMPEAVGSASLTIDIDALISKFSASQQQELRTHCSNPAIQAVLQSAERLLKTLNDRKIQLAQDRGKLPTPTLFSKLKNLALLKMLRFYKAILLRPTCSFQ